MCGGIKGSSSYLISVSDPDSESYHSHSASPIHSPHNPPLPLLPSWKDPGTAHWSYSLMLWLLPLPCTPLDQFPLSLVTATPAPSPDWGKRRCYFSSGCLGMLPGSTMDLMTSRRTSTNERQRDRQQPADTLLEFQELPFWRIYMRTRNLLCFLWDYGQLSSMLSLHFGPLSSLPCCCFPVIYFPMSFWIRLCFSGNVGQSSTWKIFYLREHDSFLLFIRIHRQSTTEVMQTINDLLLLSQCGMIEAIQWPIIPVCRGLRDFPGHETSSAETEKILHRPGRVGHYEKQLGEIYKGRLNLCLHPQQQTHRNDR